MHKRKHIFAAIVMALSMCLSADAQERTRGNIARIVFQEEVVTEPVSVQGLQGALNALREETRQLRTVTKQEEAGQMATNRIPTRRPSFEPILEDLRPEGMDEAAINEIGATDDIVERIELLKRIYKNKRIEKEKQAREATLKAQTPSEELPARATVQDAQPQSPQIEAQPAAQMNPVELIASTPPKPQGNRVFQNPINMFEMGNSLYQTGEILSALEAYVQIDKSELTASEIVWLDFMIASCQRRIGNEKEATTLYRSVANQREVPNLVKPALGWIRQLEQLSQTRSALETIEAEFESILQTAESHVKQ